MAVIKNDAAKKQIIKKLNESGYPTYARLLSYFDIYLTDNPDVVGYMIPNQAKIVLNENLDIEQISTIVRHELLHEWLTHGPRTDAFNKLNKIPRNQITGEISNIAADYEISNIGYTEKDKQIARRIRLGDKVLQGLVTEDQYPGWEKMSFEDMYEKLLKEKEEDYKDLEDLINQLQQLNQRDLEDLIDQIDQENQESEEDQGKQDSFPKDNEEEDKSKNSLNKLKKAAQRAQKDLKDQEKEESNDNAPIDSPEESKEKEDLAKRIAKIKEIFNDVKQKEQAVQDSKLAKQAEKLRKIQNASDRMKRDPLYKFKLNLTRFIADQLEEIEEETYTKFNPSYEDSDFILPGIKDVENKKVPVINIYHDTSGSFTGHPEKQKAVDGVIAALQKYEDDGDIKINRYYHADKVASNRKEAGYSNNGNEVIKHINATKPDNVIITTDGDLTNTSLSATVPGAVWMIFFGDQSQGLIDNLRGRRETKTYLIKDF